MWTTPALSCVDTVQSLGNPVPSAPPRGGDGLLRRTPAVEERNLESTFPGVPRRLARANTGLAIAGVALGLIALVITGIIIAGADIDVN